MSLRKKKGIVLSTAVLLFVLAITDIWIRNETVLENFGEQFFNENKTEARLELQRGATASSSRHLVLSSQQIQELELIGKGGEVVARRSPDASIRLQYTVTAVGPDTAAANRRLEAVKVEEVVHDGKATLSAMADGKPVDYETIAIRYELFVPEALKLQLVLSDSVARIQGVKGELGVTMNGGSLSLMNGSGPYHVKAVHGNVHASNLQGKLTLDHRFSNVHIVDLEGALALKTESGHTVVRDLKGEVTGETDRGFVYVHEVAGPVKLASRDTNIQLDHIRGDIQVAGSHSTVSLLLSEKEGYRLNAKLDGGRIRVDTPYAVESVKDRNRHYETVIGPATWKTDIQVKLGSLVVTIH